MEQVPSVSTNNHDSASERRAVLASLCDELMEAGASGSFPQDEAIFAAVAYARLLASIGGPAERCRLGSYHLLVANRHDTLGNRSRAAFARVEAAQAFQLAADNGDANAVATLNALGMTVRESPSAEFESHARDYDAMCRDAALGDVSTLIGMIEGSLLGDQHAAQYEGLVVAEWLARLVVPVSAPETLPRLASILAGVLLVRMDWELREGSEVIAWQKLEQAFSMLAALNRAGEPSAAGALHGLMNDTALLSRAGLKAVIQSFPDLLAFVTPAGIA
ncbi:hypothetical protein NED98_05715 [Sphingomonas sp. MMSM20]|uniref:hypothetical protein n=1 Tax=Sphingomonas lycopersici TaxID=2951807 RepID=UPI0022386468|nr:hypothetical protein [Sphingomonas lycopersici]MCW6529737.1 hypothetical protein [Sphingomonas lycopersici]